MRNRSAALRPTALAAGVLSSGLVVLHAGPISLVGWLLAGTLAGSWAYVYARSLCAGQRLDWQQLVRAAAWSALAMPALAVTARYVGAVWLVAGVAVVVWAVLVAPDGHVPDHVKDRWRAAQIGARQFLRAREVQSSEPHDGRPPSRE